MRLTSLAASRAKEDNDLLGPKLHGRMMEHLPPVGTGIVPLAVQARRSQQHHERRCLQRAGPRERGHLGGAPVSEIYSIGVLSAGSAFNMTVWSYVDQVDISILSDDRTFNDVHEATDAMIHVSPGDPACRRAARGTHHGRHGDGAGKARQLIQASAQHRKAPLLRQPVESGLHHRADMRVDLGDVGVLAELRHDIDRLQHLRDDFPSEGAVLGGTITLSPNGNPKLSGRISIRARVRPSRLASESPRARKQP